VRRDHRHRTRRVADARRDVEPPDLGSRALPRHRLSRRLRGGGPHLFQNLDLRDPPGSRVGDNMADFDPKALIKQYAAAVNAHDMDRLVALFDTQALIKDIAQMPLDKLRFESVVDLRGGRWPRAEAAVLDYYGTWFEAVPDLTLVLYGLVASGAQAALELTLQ